MTPGRNGWILSLLLATTLAGPFQAAHAQAGLGTALPVSGTDYMVVQDESLLAVITRRAGPAARLAHDHLVHASRYDWTLDFGPDALEDARLELIVRGAGLRIDDPDARAAAQDRLIELGILDEPFQEISESQRSEVRSEMIHPDQLDVLAHPEIRLETLGVARQENSEHPYRVEISMELRGVERMIPLRAAVERERDRVRIEAYGDALFTDFDIEPYRAFLGAVQNQDRFFLYLDLILEPRP